MDDERLENLTYHLADIADLDLDALGRPTKPSWFQLRMMVRAAVQFERNRIINALKEINDECSQS